MKELLDIAKAAVLIISPFAVVAIAWAIIIRLMKKKKKPDKVVKPPKRVAPAYIARRVMYKEELEHIKPNMGDLAYVLKENQSYFYNGSEWVKVIKHEDGAVGN
jgi:hypothetical protein